MARSPLKQQFLGSVQADESTEIELLLDGRRYLEAIAQELEQTVPSDRFYLVNWFFDPKLDLRGRWPGSQGFLEVGDLLAQKAADGVDVRVVLNGAQYLGALGAPGYTTCYDAMVDLRARRPPGAATAPLVDRVLYDWSGAELSGSQHQKATVVVRREKVTAFVGGIDFNPLMLDSAPHNSRVLPGPPPVDWGWHDGGVKLTGGVAADVYANFADRWLEAATLPESRLWVKNPGSWLPRFKRYGPPPLMPVPPLTSSDLRVNAGMYAQVLRSRYKTKLNRPWKKLSWSTAGGGELLQVHEALVRAIRSAQRYIYIEDQFLADHPILPRWMHRSLWATVDLLIGKGRLPSFSLFPHLEEALKRNVKVIMVGSGYADPGDLITGPKNRELNTQLRRLATVSPEHLAVWRAEDVTVHTKLLIVDDQYAAIGSANIQSRSMMGIDSELHVGVVDSGGRLLSEFRARLWAEHLGLDYDKVSPQLKAALDDLSVALGMWRPRWGPGGGVWFTPNNPPGFTPAVLRPGTPRTRMVRAYVGPGVSP
jgi:phosphatidylserine/phosphatidylglycerophosphate/cardiolipin synthase-like enzyme